MINYPNQRTIDRSRDNQWGRVYQVFGLTNPIRPLIYKTQTFKSFPLSIFFQISYHNLFPHKLPPYITLQIIITSLNIG